MLHFFRCTLLLAASAAWLHADDGYDLWLRYRPEPVVSRRTEYAQWVGSIEVPALRGGAADAHPMLQAAREELTRGLNGVAGVASRPTGAADHAILLGTAGDSPVIQKLLAEPEGAQLGPEGFLVRAVQQNGQSLLVVAGGGDAGVLYGVFHLLNYLQEGGPIARVNLLDQPRVKRRMANHWDNPIIGEDHWSIERGYAGDSIFHWKDLPDQIDPRLHDYARLLAAMGLNGAAVNNVNTAKHGLEGWRLLTDAWLPKVAALAGVLRPYNVRLYLSVNFFSPVIVGHLPTADPMDPAVAAWWKQKADQIYAAIPDFGGFVVKADSENEPGPYKYGRNHAQGANVIAAALAPHGGVVIWRAFVYTEKGDRVTDAYNNFQSLDGQFAANAFVQIKNGPLDFQIREPVSSLLAALPRTNEILEFEVSQEYTGQAKHVCFLAPLWKEALNFDTHARGDGSTIANLVTDRLYPNQSSGITAVMNLGSDRNWTGQLLAQANTYAYGRLAWDPSAEPAEIADEWTRLTFGRDPAVVATVTRLLLASRAVFEEYTSPLGLGLMVARGNHFTPAPAYRVNYHHADANGIGYDRTVATGSGYAGQYHYPWSARFESAETCPEDLLLFFHHVPYTWRMADGKSVLDELKDKHRRGAAAVHDFVTQWRTLAGKIDDERYQAVLSQLQGQAKLADEWRDTMNGYFAKVSGTAP